MARWLCDCPARKRITGLCRSSDLGWWGPTVQKCPRSAHTCSACSAMFTSASNHNASRRGLRTMNPMPKRTSAQSWPLSLATWPSFSHPMIRMGQSRLPASPAGAPLRETRLGEVWNDGVGSACALEGTHARTLAHMQHTCARTQPAGQPGLGGRSGREERGAGVRRKREAEYVRERGRDDLCARYVCMRLKERERWKVRATLSGRKEVEDREGEL